MKYSKAAVVVAGSMIALGVASPAFAALQVLGPETLGSAVPRGGIGLGDLVEGTGGTLEKDRAAKSAAKAVGKTAKAVRKAPKATRKAPKTVRKAGPMVGGLPLGVSLPVSG